MRYDEALTFNEFASRPLYYGLSYYPDPNNHLLNTLLMHLAFLGLGNQPWVLRLPALAAGVLLVVGFAIATALELRKRRVPLGLLAALICLLFVAAQRVAPFERVWLFLLPLYLVIAAAGLARLVDGRLLAAGFGLVLGIFTMSSGSILSSTETGAFPEAEAVTSALAPRLAPDDAVITQLPASLPELQYYFPRYGLPASLLVKPPEEGQSVWVVAPPGGQPDVAGFPNVREIQRFAGASLYQLRR